MGGVKTVVLEILSFKVVSFLNRSFWTFDQKSPNKTRCQKVWVLFAPEFFSLVTIWQKGLKWYGNKRIWEQIGFRGNLIPVWAMFPWNSIVFRNWGFIWYIILPNFLYALYIHICVSNNKFITFQQMQFS